jgi:Asp-tRNA(Asn)/Glu-tRNA(Gln) amidotransferase A subunit family amidase
MCGVYGLKPSHGRVSGLPNIDLASTTGVYGPIASSIDDLALSYRVMAAPDPANKSSSLFPPSLPPSPAAPKVLGIYREWFDSADAAVVNVCKEAVEYYANAGYEIVDIRIPFLLETQKAHALTILTEIASGVTADQISKLTPANKVLMTVSGSQARAQDFMAAQKLRNVLMQHLAFLWETHPGMIIVTPTISMAGWKIQKPDDLSRGVSDGDTTIKCMRYAWVANLSGCPAISCPVGYAPGEGGDVPIGLMGMGEWGSEEQLLQFGKDGEGILGEEGARRPTGNGIWVDVLALTHDKGDGN